MHRPAHTRALSDARRRFSGPAGRRVDSHRTAQASRLRAVSRVRCHTARDDARCRLAEYELLARKVSEEDRYSHDLPFQLLTISAARHAAQSVIAWAEESLNVLDTLESPAADPERRSTT
jgi:hypothetical protein